MKTQAPRTSDTPCPQGRASSQPSRGWKSIVPNSNLRVPGGKASSKLCPEEDESLLLCG